nr:4882_t:CDS:2 [Entrophospora candida]
MDHQFNLYSVEEEGDEHQDPTYIETDSDEEMQSMEENEQDNSQEIEDFDDKYQALDDNKPYSERFLIPSDEQLEEVLAYSKVIATVVTRKSEITQNFP